MDATLPIGTRPHRWLVWHHVSFAVVAAVLAASCGGQRLLQVTSEPSGALVRLDEDVIGTTPLAYEFENFGRRRLSLYLPGYQTYSEPLHLKTPWHATFPIDVITEVLLPLGLRYKKEVNVVLLPDDGERVLETLGSFVKRAEALREGLPGQIPTGEPIVEPAQPDPEAPVEPDPATADKP